MRGEAPRFKRCCFFIPLRRGLLGWGYLKMALNLLLVPIIYTFIYITWSHGASFTEMTVLLPVAILSIADFTFSVLLIIACHEKSQKLLKIYFIYGIVELILILASTSIMTYFEIHKAIIKAWAGVSQESIGGVVISMVATLATYFADIFVCVYVLLLVRSERMKLRDQRLEIQFVNNATEGESRCVCTDNGHDPSMQYTDNGHDPSMQYTDDGHATSVQQMQTDKDGEIV